MSAIGMIRLRMTLHNEGVSNYLIEVIYEYWMQNLPDQAILG